MSNGTTPSAILREGIALATVLEKTFIAPEIFIASEKVIIAAKRSTSNIKSGLVSSINAALTIPSVFIPCHSAMRIPPTAAARPRCTCLEAAITISAKMTRILASTGTFIMTLSP